VSGAPAPRRAGPQVVDQVVDLGAELALRAAQLGLEHRLPLADGVILATARAHGARLLTMDSDFQGLVDVELVPREGR
jgi:toxin FitB